MTGELEHDWEALLLKLNAQFGQDFDLDGVLFMIGIQELGKGYIELSKDQKLDVMHIAICHLLIGYGYYELAGLDKDGWPHYTRNQKLPPLNAKEQEQIMKEAILEYFST